MYSISYNKSFRKDIKKINKNNILMKEIYFVIDCFINEINLDKKYKKHKLKGYLSDYFEIHIRPDLLLIYKINENSKNIILSRIGSHNYLRVVV